MTAAKANVDRARADYSESESKVEAATADIELKSAQVEVARMDVDRSMAVTEFARVVAPFDGVILRIRRTVESARSSRTPPPAPASRLSRSAGRTW